ncbi:(2E,6E)-farnesyl diphosphate synthase [hydrothermal vent metagenome]|uniref:(2E,6E)-farnesyl diphosphate synthase n=1 Tax=hydrothermal vent metagenome TaxID=652676 RepID=A0A3B1E6A7_9ZZZZ
MSDVSSHTALEQTWQQYRAKVNTALEGYMQPRVDCPETLREAMAYSLLAGGKRLRPVLVLLACEACGGEISQAMPAACALEMIHTYSLIHDDLPAMDDDNMRRGRPTNHVVYGEGNAILAGDGLLTYAFEIISRDVHPTDVAVRCLTELATAAGAIGMVGGQVVDLEAETSGIKNIEHLESIHRRKTGALLTSALVMGGVIAGISEKVLQSLIEYGQCIGMAFQITDDLLDITGDSERMGKGVQKDANHGKLTYPALFGVEESRQKAEDYIQRACEVIALPQKQTGRLESLARFILERDH